MSDPRDPLLQIGPVACTWFAHARGTPAQSLALPWIGQRLQRAPASLGVWRDAHGRPRLGPDLAGHDINWSHSGSHLLVGVGEGVRLGVDLELLRPRLSAMALADRFFTREEARYLAALPADAGEAAFVRLWCAKEAVLKAHGRGIAFGLDRLQFAEHAGAWRLVACDPALGPAEDWQLHAFSPLPGYLATVAWIPDAG